MIQSNDRAGEAGRPAIISCSPRPGGNSDRAAALFTHGAMAAGLELRVDYLRRFRVEPCVSCYRCKHDPKRACYLADMDHSGRLFQMMLNAPYVFLASPIYFYHVPAQLKAWIDRSQCYYMRRQDGDPVMAALPRRKAYVCLIAGRSQGDKLFEGSLLTLKYFLDVFNFELQPPLLFRGLDEAGDLEANAEAVAALENLGREAAREALERAEA
ncbi:multimeric flavodoxin WrbA [Desulfobaculum xiamenense]|uniref:Multimeric flavodoxin WrbA n=1 Tax=Desulfobaculum xiamenense TaxID=995050 RepID=A0A846QUX3_9BACT|nr:flavodoxin family protein [Desulfobaculum xiamenense]NJB68924.1 multimeric flavodoxin WrbA [Desulfobaculum xiamenense]